MEAKYRIEITDVTLRDGMHAVRHQFSVDDARAIATALDGTGVALIEATHGDGLGGSSIQYGFAKENEDDYIRTVCDTVKESKVAALLLPGIGRVQELRRAAELGIKAARVATHSTEADISMQHIAEARGQGLDTVGFLMMSSMTSPFVLAEEAKKMASYGAHCVYIVDSAGAMLMDEVRINATYQRHGRAGLPGKSHFSPSVGNGLSSSNLPFTVQRCIWTSKSSLARCEVGDGPRAP